MFTFLAQVPITIPDKIPESVPALVVWMVCSLLVVVVTMLWLLLMSRDKSNTEDRALLKELVQDARIQVQSSRSDQVESQNKYLTSLEGVRSDFRDQAHKSREMFAQTVDKVVSDGEKKMEKICVTFAQGFKDLSDKVEKHGCRSG